MNNYRNGFGHHWRLDRVSFVSLAATGLIMVLSVVTFTPTPSLGGERGRERPNRQQVFDMLAARLQLSDQQKVAVGPIFADEVSKRRELMDKLRLEMDRLDRETADRLDKVLSTEQMAQYDKMLEERRHRGGERQVPPPGQEGASPRPPEDGGQSRLSQ
jgi:hypothetical protein